MAYTKEEIEADRKRMNLLREKAKESQAGPAGAVVTMHNDLNGLDYEFVKQNDRVVDWVKIHEDGTRATDIVTYDGLDEDIEEFLSELDWYAKQAA